MKTFRFTYKYKNTLINLVLTGVDELDALKSFEKYANKFKLPINNKMNINPTSQTNCLLSLLICFMIVCTHTCRLSLN